MNEMVTVLQQNISLILIYLIPTIVLILAYRFWQKRKHHRAEQALASAKKSGLHEPASLHPVIDPNKCLGCGSCVSACPEGKILGLIDHKAKLISPASCIGHGACKEACPFDAIRLVFGTETRGVDIPNVSEDFQTNIDGIYIAGELGGMGLIKNAIKQGVEAMDAIAKQCLKRKHSFEYDVAIVGAGPAGLSAGLAAIDQQLNYILLEQDTVGGTLAHYPRGKVVMTEAANLPLVGKFQFREVSKETLIDFWHQAIEKTGLLATTGHRVERIEKQNEGFSIVTNQQTLTARFVLLTIGRRGTPRTLDVPGENLPKVVYRLIDAEQYQGRRVLVVGGGDSALEAALSIADEPGTTVTLSYRSQAFSRAKPKNRDRIDAAVAANKIDVALSSQVSSISEGHVTLNTQEGLKEIANDDVIVCAGGVLPSGFLKETGIKVETKYGSA